MAFEKQQLEKQLTLENEKKEQYQQLQEGFQQVVDFAKLSYKTSVITSYSIHYTKLYDTRASALS